MMTPERWQRVKELLGPALELEPARRTGYLEQACANDATLRRDIELLLAAEKKAGSDFLNDPALTEAFLEDFTARAADAWIGRRIGPYEIVEEIGAGGMGEVYRAVRADDQYRKEVAIKLVPGSQGSSFSINRFKNERQILASLDHPNIARLLDGGTTDEGVPYFVMELIEGQPIIEYCDARKLPVPERLNLFLQVCSAVQYAHQRLIIHRDIKPGNILVTAEGVPNLLDFGIAKIVNPDAAAEGIEPTITMFRLLTPGYASPEQIKGETITTASDVYSLGVVLYELLTGQSPYRIASRTPHEISQAVCAVEPEKPSAAARRIQSASAKEGEEQIVPTDASAARDTSPEKLSKRLSGDLDTIALMALRKEPQRRYASIEQFAQDIRRHLGHLPVTARKDTLGYRASKFVARHKVAVAAAALVTIALLTAIGVTFREARIAQRRFNDVRSLANSLIFDVHDSIQDLPGSTPARKLIVEKALRYLDSLAQESRGDVSLQRELATAYEKVGDVQGNPYFANLGDGSGASTSYQKSLAIRLELLKINPSNLDVQRELHANYTKIAVLRYVNGDFQGSEDIYRKCLAIDEKISTLTSSPDDLDNLAADHGNLGFAVAVRGHLDDARKEYVEALSIWQKLSGNSPNAKLQFRLAGISERLADVLMLTGDSSQAVSLANSAVKIREELSTADPTNAARRQQLAVSYKSLGDLLEYRRNIGDALQNYEKTLEISQSLSSADPTNIQARRIVGDSYNEIGRIMSESEEPLEGLKNHQKALEMFNALSKTDPDDELIVTGIADCYSGFGLAHSILAENPKNSRATQASHWVEARKWYRRSIDQWAKAPEANVGVNQIGNVTPDKIKQEIAKCDAALAKLRSR